MWLNVSIELLVIPVSVLTDILTEILMNLDECVELYCVICVTRTETVSITQKREMLPVSVLTDGVDNSVKWLPATPPWFYLFYWHSSSSYWLSAVSSTYVPNVTASEQEELVEHLDIGLFIFLEL